MFAVRNIKRVPALVLCLASLSMSSALAAPSSANIVPAGTPQWLLIPKLGVRASVEHITMLNPQDVHAPYKWEDVAWSSFGPRPGERGNATIFGHVDSTCCPAVFYHLHTLVAGDQFDVLYRGNRALRFRVMWSTTYANSKLPVKWLYGRDRNRGLTLITCTGDFHRDGSGYDHKYLVYSRLILPNGTLG